MLNVGFVTCVELGLSCMQAIYSAGGELNLAITLHDSKAQKKSGRVYLDSFCKDHDIPLVKVDHVNDHTVQEAIAKQDIDWLFIVGWSQIAGKETLQAPSRGCIGIHPTLLPGGRGRAPIPWAIIKGLSQTGVTLFVLDEGVDSGPVIAQESVEIESGETATSLYEKINVLHREVIRNVWSDLVGDEVQPQAQDESKATYWPGRRPEDGEVFADMTVADVDRLVRGVTRPYPGAFFRSQGRTMRIWSGHCAAAGQDLDSSAIKIELADGNYIADDWEWEADS